MITIEDRLTDLIPEILSYLPVKSLMRFQCVHKSWYDLINTQCFITKHLHTFNGEKASNASNFNHIILKNFPCKLSNDILVSLLYVDKETDSFFLHYLKLFTVSAGVANLEICGPCNGIYFIHNNQQSSVGYSMLINPSRREFRFIPKFDFPRFQINFSIYPGFGFDHKTNDYKVFFIITTQIRAGDYFRYVMIYSLNSNSWREILNPVPWFTFAGRMSNASVQGVFHRCVWDGSDNIILAFNVAEEVFKKIELPKTGDYSWGVMTYKDSIGAVGSHVSFDYGRNFEFWIMVEYGNEGSWIHYLSIDTTQGIERILGLWKDDDEILMIDDQHNMVLYDHKRQNTRILGISFGVGCKQAAFYMESLISLRRENEVQVFFLEIRPQRPRRKVLEQKRKQEPFQPDNSRLKRVCR